MPPSRLLVPLSSLAVPIAWVGCDLAFRASILPPSGLPMYAVGALLSGLVWGLAMEAVRDPRRAVRALSLGFLAFTAAFGIGLQAIVRAFTHAYVGRRALVLAIGIQNLTRSSYVTHHALGIFAACAAPAAIVVGVAMARARWLGRRADSSWAIPFATALAVLVTVFAPFAVQGIQCLPPDVLWLNGTGGPILYAAGLQPKPKALPAGRHEALPEAPPVARDAPSIVLLLGESVRRDAVCSARAPGCELSPRLDAAAPNRIGFARAFSTASCTELAASALWTGLPVTAGPEAFARAPLLWDWAKARGYRTAYITSQNLLFQQSDAFLRGSRIDRLREARDRAADAPIDGGSPDEDTTDEALAFLAEGEGPAFVVVHYANTHAPYRQTPGFTPHSKEDPRGRYENSLAHNDAVLGDLVARLRASARGRRAIVVSTSDHGEAWGEHGVAYHSFDLYAEQISVPLWLDIPQGSLGDASLERLRRDAPTRAVALGDVTATVVDLLGGLEIPAFRDRAAALYGSSLLGEAPAQREVLLWNCPPMRECVADAFGVVAPPLKLHYVGREQRYRCQDLEADPDEARELPIARCADLLPALDRAFGPRVEGTRVGEAEGALARARGEQAASPAVRPKNLETP